MLVIMQTEIGAIICGLAAGIGWGFSGFFDAKASRSVGPLVASFVINGIVAVGFAALYILFFLNTFTIDTLGIFYAISSGVVITIGALSYFRGLSLGPVSLVSPLSAAYPLVTTVIAIAIFQVVPTLIQLDAIGMIMFGVLAASGLLSVRGISVRKLEKGPLFGVFTALSWGVGYALASQAISRLGWQTASFIEFTAMALAFGIFVPMIKSERRISWVVAKTAIKNTHVLLAGIISLGAAVTLNIGLSLENNSGAIVAALSAFYPVLTVMLARRSFNEKVAFLPLIGAFISIAGVVLISLNI